MLEYVKILKTFDPEISPKEIIGQLHKDILVGMLPVLYKWKNWKQLNRELRKYSNIYFIDKIQWSYKRENVFIVQKYVRDIILSEGRKNHHGQSHSYKIIEILFLFVCMYREISAMIVTKLTVVMVMFMLLDLRVFKRYFVSLLAFSTLIMHYLL